MKISTWQQDFFSLHSSQRLCKVNHKKSEKCPNYCVQLHASLSCDISSGSSIFGVYVLCLAGTDGTGDNWQCCGVIIGLIFSLLAVLFCSWVSKRTLIWLTLHTSLHWNLCNVTEQWRNKHEHLKAAPWPTWRTSRAHLHRLVFLSLPLSFFHPLLQTGCLYLSGAASTKLMIR